MTNAAKYSFTEKWIRLLFLTIIPSTIFGILSHETISGIIPILGTIGNIGKVGCSLLYGLILIKLSSEYDYYKAAGITYILSILISFVEVNNYIGSSLFVSSVAIILSISSTYFEFTGHTDILSKEDYLMSANWNKLKKWTIILYAIALISVIFIFFFPILTLLSTFVSMIGILVVEIVKFIYLYKTANIFKKLAEEENVSRETL